MDKRFPLWLSLRLKSRADVNHRVSKMDTILSSGDITSDIFSDDLTLRNYLQNTYLGRSAMRTFFMDENFTDEEDGSTLSSATQVHDIEAMCLYMEFLGRSSVISSKLRGMLSQKVKMLQQANVSAHVQDHQATIRVMLNLCQRLRERQAYINERIMQWMYLGNLAEYREGLFCFGTNEMRPFIELCLRYLFLPMTAEQLIKLEINLERTLPKNVDSLFGKDAYETLYGEERGAQSKSNGVLFLSDDGTSFVYTKLMSPYGGTLDQCKIVRRTIDPTISFYIYWYRRHCTEWSDPESKLLFVSKSGNPWKNLRSDVYRYVKGVLGTQLAKDIGVNSGMYTYTSKLQWISWRALRHRNINQIAMDAQSVGLGFKNDDKYYRGLQGLRKMFEARKLLRFSGKDTSDIQFSLGEIPSELDAMRIEMSSRNVPRKKRVMGAVRMVQIPNLEPWSDIGATESLYTQNFKKNTGTTLRVRDILNKEKKRLRERTIRLPSDRIALRKERQRAQYYVKSANKYAGRAQRYAAEAQTMLRELGLPESDLSPDVLEKIRSIKAANRVPTEWVVTPYRLLEMDNNQFYVCPIDDCMEYFETQADIQQHIINVHADANMDMMSAFKLAPLGLCSCPYCSKLYKIRRGIKLHVRNCMNRNGRTLADVLRERNIGPDAKCLTYWDENDRSWYPGTCNPVEDDLLEMDVEYTNDDMESRDLVGYIHFM